MGEKSPTDKMKRMEYNWVYSVITKLPKEIKILDAGCGQGILAGYLNLNGYHVIGVDIQEYGKGDIPHTWQDKERILEKDYVQGDLQNLKFSDESFDAVYCVNVIHAVGVGRYADNTDRDKGDRKAIEEFIRILKPEGIIVLTTAYGKAGWMKFGRIRIYDDDRLKMLLEGLEILEKRFFYFDEKKGAWIETQDPKEIKNYWPNDQEDWRGDIWLVLKKVKK